MAQIVLRTISINRFLPKLPKCEADGMNECSNQPVCKVKGVRIGKGARIFRAGLLGCWVVPAVSSVSAILISRTLANSSNKQSAMRQLFNPTTADYSEKQKRFRSTLGLSVDCFFIGVPRHQRFFTPFNVRAVR